MEVQQVSELLTLLVGRCVELVEDLSRRWLLNRSLEGAELHQFYLLSELLPSLVPLSHVKADDVCGAGVRGSQPGFAQATANLTGKTAKTAGSLRNGGRVASSIHRKLT